MDPPYFPQITDDSCGAAVTQMFLAEAGVTVDQHTLIGKLGISEQQYTPKAALKSVLSEYGFSYEEFACEGPSGVIIPERNFELMHAFVERGWLAFLNILQLQRNGELIGHYVLAFAAHGADSVIVHDPDPAFGPRRTLHRAELDPIWRSGLENYTRWFLASGPTQRRML
ncbi:MAG TPA: hypothetical protein VJH88_04665 [Candidatus Nanoarchaeia archaeon]|nr:hypothetical protein [Candidatus Nanoarchaeia archaeon]